MVCRRKGFIADVLAEEAQEFVDKEEFFGLRTLALTSVVFMCLFFMWPIFRASWVMCVGEKIEIIEDTDTDVDKNHKISSGKTVGFERTINPLEAEHPSLPHMISEGESVQPSLTSKSRAQMYLAAEAHIERQPTVKTVKTTSSDDYEGSDG